MNIRSLLDGNDYIHIKFVSSDLPVVIAFSSVNTSKGKFTFFNSLKNIGLNVIFINDSDNRWYTYGINGLNLDVRKDALDLVSFARETGNGKVFTFGSSMGAYAAALYCSLGNADGFISFGAEVTLGIEGSRSKIHMKVPFNEDYINLVQYIKDFNKPNLIFVPENDDLDLLTLKALRDYKNLNIVLLSSSSHPGFDIIRNNNFNSILLDFCLNDGYLNHTKYFEEGILSNDTNIFSDSVITAFYQHYLYRLNKQNEDSLEVLLEVSKLAVDSSSYNLRLGDAYRRIGDMNNAIVNWKKSENLCAQQYEATAKIAAEDFKKGNYKKALEGINNANAIFPHSAHQYNMKGKIHEKMTDYTVAEDAYRKATKINPGNLNFKKSLKSFIANDIARKAKELLVL
ncbi:tetratricopeptide repeat protein [Psychrobacter sp.]|uniref:tetratricopeptide repeat protein n=1 Tax=Psychrobacter sp. TaxID=56811 RepID=UPI003F9C5CF6